jgi:LPS sulfotransferase NodH
MDSNSSIQRFMILGTARTGSNFLLSLLSAHPYIKTYGELFNLDALPKGSLLEALEDPIMFLRRRVYGAQKPEITAVGFKMFYDHLTKDYFQKAIDLSETSLELRRKFTQFFGFVERNYEWGTLHGRFRATWAFIRGDRSLAVIHLKRWNTLHTLISLKRAFITRQWWSLKSYSEAARTIHLDPDECCRYFNLQETYAAEADMAFADHPKIDVIYEELAERQQPTLQRIFTFLGVPYALVTTRMRKQNLAPPWQAVDNYEQLKSYFQHTKWSAFFN